ncbi:MAG: hypothetical protein NC180_02700 [Muribaculaceae bacterium]|nr:catabolite control protein A [Roseburia sp.]MCM1432085.1 hypothetical protein [Muribaculaceae bacterium]MCM1492115.1 hypothetical protein [Muribaculaceae bacterium]
MMRKRVIAGMFTAVMLFLLSACGGTPDAAETVTERQAGEEAAQENTKATEKNEQSQGMDMGASIEETVLVEEEEFKITAMGLEYTGYSVELNVTIENTSDEELSFTSGTIGYGSNAINGYMIGDGYMNKDVSAGKKANESISFSTSELEIYGITEIADIQLGIKVQDKDYNDVYVGVSQIKTSIAETYDYSVNTYQEVVRSGRLEAVSDCSVDYYAEDELYNQGSIRIISEVFLTNLDGEQMLLLEVVNDSSDYVYGCTSDISLNGLSVKSGSWSSDAINPGAHCLVDLSMSSTLDSAYWDYFGISEIGEIALSFSVDDSEHNEIMAPQELSIEVSDKTVEVDESGTEVYQENGIRIISKGIIEDSFRYSNSVHMLFLIDNQTNKDLYFDVAYDSLSVNGYMADQLAYRAGIKAGEKGILDVEIMGNSLEDIGISGVDEITDAELIIDITNERYDNVAEASIQVTY